MAKKSNIARAAFKITVKNITTEKAKAATLNEVVYQLAPLVDNAKLVELLDKQGRVYSMTSLRWYASKARAGVRR